MFTFEQYSSGPQDAAEQLKQQLKRWTSKRLLIPAVAILPALVGRIGFLCRRPRRSRSRLAVRPASRDHPVRTELPPARPIQNHYIVNVRSVRSTEIGYRTVAQRSGQNVVQRVPAEALMLTGDENIVEVQLFVQYIIQDPFSTSFEREIPKPPSPPPPRSPSAAWSGETPSTTP